MTSPRFPCTRGVSAASSAHPGEGVHAPVELRRGESVGTVVT